MSQYLIRFPDGFIPEEYGWELVDGLDGPGGPITQWVRWQPPFRFPAGLNQCVEDEESGAVGGWLGVLEGTFSEGAKPVELWAEMRTPLAGARMAEERVCQG